MIEKIAFWVMLVAALLTIFDVLVRPSNKNKRRG